MFSPPCRNRSLLLRALSRFFGSLLSLSEISRASQMSSTPGSVRELSSISNRMRSCFGQRIQPFHLLFKAACAEPATTFWQIESEDAKRDFYIGRDGKISLSAKWCEAGYAYGTVEDTIDVILSSAKRTALLRMAHEPSSHFHKCRGCAISTICSGYLMAHALPARCDMWRKVHDAILGRAKEIKTIIHRLQNKEGYHG